jgi:hypothetical protein
MPKARVPSKGERLAHGANARFHRDGRPYTHDELVSSEDEAARKRRRRRARLGQAVGPDSEESDEEIQEAEREAEARRKEAERRSQQSGGSVADQLSRLCTLPSPTAAKLVADLNTVRQKAACVSTTSFGGRQL